MEVLKTKSTSMMYSIKGIDWIASGHM
ncbi:BnaA05g10430D [Brassica napus]|uniref:BnaA05g10430D protein n=1 Tax=Brassica napus TaxID=3708 RepID=A0A078FRM4_BRANA|nr:BnaA05g10430D [Brassica napus]